MTTPLQWTGPASPVFGKLKVGPRGAGHRTSVRHAARAAVMDERRLFDGRFDGGSSS
jgi:hypothetical protein